MNPDASQLLAQLADIHRAGEPGWWPAAPGWWLLAALVLLALLFLLRRLARRLAVRRRRRRWLLELDAITERYRPETQPHQHLAALNRLFRAVALRAFPESACARLQGREWVDFIAASLPAGADADSLEALAREPYRESPSYDAEALQRMAHTWVRQYG